MVTLGCYLSVLSMIAIIVVLTVNTCTDDSYESQAGAIESKEKDDTLQQL